MVHGWRGLRSAGWALAGGVLALSSPAWAQDDSFSLNTILVATFEAEQPFLAAEADRVEALVRDALNQEYIALAAADVPPFEAYDAPTYIRACPKGQYVGCMFVVAGKAQTEWAVGGGVRAIEGGYRVTVQVVDVANAMLVAEFDTDMDGDDDVPFQEGVRQIMGAVLAGDVGQLQDEAANRRAKQEAEAEAAAAKLAAAAAQVADQRDVPDTVERAPEQGEAEFYKEPARPDNPDGLEAWERTGLTRMQFKRYEATGEKLTTFRQRLKGRQGQLLVRLSGQVGIGPWGTRYLADYKVNYEVDDLSAISASDITDERLVQVQTNDLGLTYGGQVEVGVGILPWLEVGVFGGVRFAPFEVQFTRSIWQQDDVSGGDVYGSLGWQVGGRVGVAPFPVFPVRPTLHLGISYWKGADLESVIEPPSGLDAGEVMGPSTILLGHVQPGIEVDLGRTVSLWTRFDLDLALAGRTSQKARIQKLVDSEYDVDSDAYKDRYVLANPVDDEPDTGTSLGGSVGVTFRINLSRR